MGRRGWLALAFEGLGVLNGDIEAFARLAAMFGAQDERRSQGGDHHLWVPAAFDARKEASASSH